MIKKEPKNKGERRSDARCLTKAGNVSTSCFRTVDRDQSLLVNQR